MVDAGEQTPVAPPVKQPEEKAVSPDESSAAPAATHPPLETPSTSLEDTPPRTESPPPPSDATEETAEDTVPAEAVVSKPEAAAEEAEETESTPSSAEQLPVSSSGHGEMNGDAAKEGDQAEVAQVEEDEHAEHATIAEVIETSNPADTKEEKIEDVITKIKAMMACETVEVLESGEILVLPKGWSTRASKTHGGKTYYVSPYGQTQWLRPPMKTNIGYKWVHEIEVTFGDGRLGLNLKQISSEPGQPFTDILVHIAEIYKLGSGMASPAEIYNWSVKPEKRLQVGMRMTAINGIPLTGCTYNDVLDRVNRLPRPLRIKFADISRGIVGRVKEEAPPEETEDEKEARENRMRQSDLRMEYLQALVSHELHLQVWKVSKRRMQKREQELKKKDEILAAQLAAMTEYQSLLEKEKESLIQETDNLNQMIEQLKLQEAGAVPSPEVAKTPALQERNVTLDNEVADIMKENEELRQERAELDEEFDALQKELDVYGGGFEDANGRDEIDVFSSAFLGSLVDRGSLDCDSENAREVLLTRIRERRRQLDLDLYEEEEQVRALESELLQLRKQMTSVDISARREDDLISGDKPPQLIALEVKVEAMRKSLHETVTALAAAAKEGNRAKMDNLSIRRTGLKEDLRQTLDEIHKFEIEFGVQSSIMDRRLSAYDSQSSGRFSLSSSMSMESDVPPPPTQNGDAVSLQEKLSVMRADLHDTVTQLARAASAKDTKLMKELSGRRLQLKEEVKAIQDEYQQLTRESMALPPMPPRPSLDRGSMDRFPPNDGASRGSMDRLQLHDGRERSNSRSSSLSTASHASHVSQAMSVDSNMNRPVAAPKETVRVNPSVPTVNAMPLISGHLMKHPSHSNDKGMFGNMSLRGVRERYCVLDGSGWLIYFKRKSDREPRGKIPLDHPSLEVVYAPNEAKSSEFSICTPTHQNKFVAKTREEMMRWVTALETTHAMLMERRSVTSGGDRSSAKSTTLGHQESSLSNEDTPDASSRRSNDGLAPAVAAAAADGSAGPRGSLSAHRSSQHQEQQHRATLGF